MKKILHIIASPRGDASQSTGLANAYLETLKGESPDLVIDILDLWQEKLPEFDGDKAAAKMTFFGVGQMDEPRQSAWDQVVEITSRFSSADAYVLSVPMWNGGIPYKLKQYIDIITQPGLLFGFDPAAGYSGLLEGKAASVFYTAGVYGPGAPVEFGADHHSTYLAWWLNFIGVKEVETVRFQPSLLTGDPAGDQKTALQRAANLARSSL